MFLNTGLTKGDYIYVFRKFRKLFFFVKLLVFVQTWNRFSSGHGSLLSNQCHRYKCCTVFLLCVDKFCKMYPFLVLLNQLAIFFATWLVIKSSFYRKLLQFQGIIVPRSNGLFGFISPNSFLFWNHSSRRHCLKNHCCWYVISKIIF